MEVRDRLADNVVHGDERSFCSERIEHSARSSLNGDQERLHEVLRQIQQRLGVANRCDQHVTLEDRPMIKEGDHVLAPRHNRSIQFTTDDLADHITHGTRLVSCWKWTALEAIVEHLAPGSWTYTRQPDRRELAATAVLAVSLAEAKRHRTGPPSDEADDVAAGGRWAGSCLCGTIFESRERVILRGW
jgi:hypothetical protein